MKRILPQMLLVVTLLFLAMESLPERCLRWSRRTRERGDTIGFVVITAGVVGLAIMIIAWITPVVQKYLSQIR